MAENQLTLSQDDFESLFTQAKDINQNGIVYEGSTITIKIDIVVNCNDLSTNTLLSDSVFTFSEEFITSICP